ncbi:DNA-processing protein DprA [Marinobacter sp. DUT-1]|uniref:DNA-processing protein DprA n=1 Tax=Marinobacter sp. DUT-1 TaxID=3412037 RepID=UPI003D16D50A
MLSFCLRESVSVEKYFHDDVVKNNKYTEQEIREAEHYADVQLSVAKSYGHHIISMNDEAYPESLRSVSDPPPLLYCSGNLSLLKRESVTIIGTREPTDHGARIAERVTSWFVSDGWVITSGLAKGVDTLAHQSCLVRGGSTIAVLAHGLEKIYPASNKELARKIVDNGGLLISEYGYNSFVARSNFVERDRIQAALAKGVVLVQSDLRGGSLHASRSALRYGRYLVVLGQSIRDIRRSEPKTAANLLLADSEDFAKLELLNVSPDKLKNLLYLRDKSELPPTSSKLRSLSFDGKVEDSSDLFR